MNKIIYSILVFSCILLIANASPKTIKFSSVEINIDDTTKQGLKDSLHFSKHTIDDQLAIISNIAYAENISKGQTIYEANCGRCHKLYKPEKRNINAWLNVMKRMAPEANLSEQNYKLVCVYLNSKTTSKEIIKDSTDKEEFIFSPQQW